MTQAAWGDDQTRFFFELTPDRVLEAVEASGLVPTGRCSALNSFENRVYDIELDDDQKTRRVVKFYRPGRWSREQILEEHQFIRDLVEAEIPAVAPLEFPDGLTLHPAKVGGIWYTIFPRIGGRSPDELPRDSDGESLRRIGRLLGRIHNVGAARDAPHRIQIGPDSYGLANLRFLLAGNWVPLEFQGRYQRAVEKICEISRPFFARAAIQRLHGDCHLGNLLSNQKGLFFVDFDDMVRGPAVQDLWLLLPARPDEDDFARHQLNLILAGYEEMRDFEYTSLKLIEPLRALRYVHYTAWIARRWEDPAFPLAFPQFGSHQYWSEQTEDLEHQLRILEKIQLDH